MDFVAMSLCGKKVPVCEPSNAASLGFFDKRKLQFDLEALDKAGIDAGILPEVRPAGTVVGYYKDIPVYIPIGDNQAAFLGSVSEKEKTVHVTIGTSSQISVYTDSYVEVPPLDTRPLPGGGYILVGAALCGGVSFAMLKDFYAQVAEQFTGVPGVMVDIQDTIEGFRRILDGECDYLPEQAFLNVGTIEDAIAKGKKILEQAK
jgi:sedoheptulokinase